MQNRILHVQNRYGRNWRSQCGPRHSAALSSNRSLLPQELPADGIVNRFKELAYKRLLFVKSGISVLVTCWVVGMVSFIYLDVVKTARILDRMISVSAGVGVSTFGRLAHVLLRGSMRLRECCQRRNIFGTVEGVHRQLQGPSFQLTAGHTSKACSGRPAAAQAFVTCSRKVVASERSPDVFSWHFGRCCCSLRRRSYFFPIKVVRRCGTESFRRNQFLL